MDEEIKNGYLAGIGCFILSGVMGISAVSVGWDLSGQFLTFFSVGFGTLSLGSFIKPKSIGHIAGQMLENMAKNNEPNSNSYSQKGGNKSTNIQGKNVNVTITKDDK